MGKRAKIGVKIFKLMTKIRKISNFQHTFSFKSPEENFSSLYGCFLETNLGKIYQSIPWVELVEEF